MTTPVAPVTPVVPTPVTPAPVAPAPVAPAPVAPAAPTPEQIAANLAVILRAQRIATLAAMLPRSAVVAAWILDNHDLVSEICAASLTQLAAKNALKQLESVDPATLDPQLAVLKAYLYKSAVVA